MNKFDRKLIIIKERVRIGIIKPKTAIQELAKLYVELHVELFNNISPTRMLMLVVASFISLC